jgi:orotidine 5'-phosphate decarboxylase subfamily 1
MTYTEKAQLAKNPTAKKLLQLMQKKQSNLSVALDVTTADALLNIADAVGPHICVLKTHIDTLDDFSDDVITRLLELANEHQFLIFEDRKFADIGNTVKLQYGGGIYHIADWADIVNAHTIPGPGVIAGLQEVGLPKGRGLLLIAEMSSAGSLATGAYTKATYAWAQEHTDFVIGFIGKGNTVIPESMLVMTPGVNIAEKGDTLGQQYQTPEEAIAAGSDVIIVGRGVYRAPDPAAAAAAYQQAGWKAYEARQTTATGRNS